MSRKPRHTITPEERASGAALAAAAMGDPRVRAKISASVKAWWAKRRAEGKARQAMSPEGKAALAASLEKQRRCPKAQANRVAAIKRHIATPGGKARYAAHAIAINARRRGFSIPASKSAEYKFLTQTKHLTADEAGRILGLL